MIFQSIKMAWKAILSNKMRSLLTMLGIIIGVVSLVVLVSLVNSATSSITEQIASMGNDMLTVQIRDDKGKPLKLSDLGDISDDASIGLVSPVGQSSATVKQGVDSHSVSVTATNNAYFQIQKSELLYGRLLLQPDLDNSSYVVVLSYEAAEEIFGRSDVVGLTLTMDGRKYQIVGVLAEENSMMMSFSQMYTVYIPYTLAERLSAGGGSGGGGMGGGGGNAGIETAYVAAESSELISAAETALRSYLMGRFNGDEDAFYIQNMNTLSETMSSVTNTFALLLGGIAAISLLVGGIGIMNIMLVSVTERTREIGIRKSIGATAGSVLSQFLVEALAICLIGCAIGILISGAILMVVNSLDDSTTYALSGDVLLIAVLFSTLIGVIFGLYPAQKAARMHPIDALRHE